jgi:hypothetical protein
MIAAILKFFRPRYAYKSAITGRFVSRAFAEANPTTTVRIKL